MATLVPFPRQLIRSHAPSLSHSRCANSAAQAPQTMRTVANLRCAATRRTPSAARGYSSSSSSGKRPRFSQRLGEALRNSKIQWYQIPVGLGIGFLGLVQFYKVSAREREKERQRELEEVGDGEKAPRKRPRIRPDGPWYVHRSDW